MHLTGHKAILLEALARLSDDEARGLAALTSPPPAAAVAAAVDPRERLAKVLLPGVYYPDLPCAKRTVRGGRVRHTRMRLCSVRKLVGSVGLSTRLMEIYASHNGVMSYLHAMAPLPDARVRQVRDRVLAQTLVLFATALCDDTSDLDLPPESRDSPRPNPFWLGQALHVLMDSYSPAHTLRANSRRVDLAAARAYASSGDKVRKAMGKVPAQDRLAMSVYAAAREAAKTFLALERRQRQQLSGGPRMREWIVGTVLRELARAEGPAAQGVVREALRVDKKTVKRICEAFDISLFNEHTEQRFRIGDMVRRASLKTQAETQAENQAETRAIAGFFNYLVQDKLFHTRNDLLAKVDKYGLRGEVVDQCVAMLRAYLAATRRVYAGAKTSRSAAARAGSARREVAALAKALSSSALALAPGFADTHCNLTPGALRKAKAVLQVKGAAAGAVR